ncbi:MAG: DUF2283 domain-containing protein [Thermodesulfovibrionia bacterium]|nr:DUF2283 domain-containing protein [Thermodesulfovibrionia bacterium]
MKITYNNKIDLLYIRLDESMQDVINKRVSDDVVLDIGEGDKIIGIEILEASTHVDLSKILPIQHEGIQSTVTP